ncbi:CDP-glycerol glycerophosphotransferase family protein [Zunongwangia sp. HRR-M8]|uniref:CDP-glycerol glycerophosphotransferase family protein n=1 Tax=Zunongwangia sp. HRR-M8 TaxID=3015170 RepID=UPI0022DE0D48|nr:CDP-glycerol glycerophosphotransferase family protein [Zunongwangia sp. HRR-M8]WBL21414.1 CDP-glycerol glycerophosphotransferase family protein [Zunongwangia sp. HRR-M8]
MQKLKIAFLFLDEIHHVSHFISVAKELSKNHEVKILTYKNATQYLYDRVKTIKAEDVKIEELPTKRFRAFTDKLKDIKIPRKGFWIKKNLDYLLQFDAVIFTDYFHKYLQKARGEKEHPKVIKLNHGIPGRAYAFKAAQSEFDMQVLVGSFQKKVLSEKNILAKNHAIGGYPKLDVVKEIPAKRYFENEKPIVLYNPHFDAEFSSWDKFGVDILKYFSQQNTYNLIFAPHLHLFQQKKGNRNIDEIPQEIYDSGNIYIDLGSSDSVDMQYTRVADLYLGDVSSQVYEFILNPRPCLFLNPSAIHYDNKFDYRFWQSGPVIENLEDFTSALKMAFKTFKDFEPIQSKLNSENFFVPQDKTASENIAEIISKYLKE